MSGRARVIAQDRAAGSPTTRFARVRNEHHAASLPVDGAVAAVYDLTQGEYLLTYDGRMTVVAAQSWRLTPDELERYATDGFVVRPSVFTRDDLADIVAACEELVGRLVKHRRGSRVTQGSYVFEPDELTEVTIKWEGDTDVVHGLEPFAHLSPTLNKWAEDPRLTEPMIDIVRDEQPVLFTEKLNLKRARHGGRNPLHQDFPYWDGFADDANRIATAMVFLDDSNIANGTLEVVPGSHTTGKWRTRSDRDGFGNLELDPALEDEVTPVPLEVPAGSVVFFGPFLVHKSAPNQSDRDRRALLYSYQPAGLAHGLVALRRAREQKRS